MTNFEASIQARIRDELHRINVRITEIKKEPLSQEMECGGDNTPFSEEMDAISATEEKELRSDVLARLIDRAAALDQALQRLSLGTYGICVSCGRRIPRCRLEQVPEAAYCVACWEAKEASRPEGEAQVARWRRVNETEESRVDYEA